MDFQKALDWRYAPKKLLPDKMVPEEKIERILAAARKAPSSNNLQPWKFVVISDKVFQEKLQKVCDDQEKVGQASHIVVILARTVWGPEYAGQLARSTAEVRGLTLDEEKALEQKLISRMSNKTGEALFAWTKQQAFIALGFLLAAAAVEEVDAGPMGGFKRQQVDELLGLTGTDFSTAVVVALGYRDPTDVAGTVPKVRLPESDVIERRP